MPSTPPTLNNTLGAQYIGVTLSTLLYGMTILQTYAFIVSPRSSKDKWYTYLFVATLFLLETVQQGILTCGLYKVLIGDLANPSLEHTTRWSGPFLMISQGFLGIIAIALVRLFFAMRVWTAASPLKKWVKHFLLGLIIALDLAFTITAFLYVSDNLQHYATDQTGQGQGALGRDRILTSSFAISVDVIICGSLIWILRQYRTGFNSMDAIVTSIIRFVIHTGLLFTLLNLVTLITTYSLPNTSIYAIFSLMVGKVYIISALATLNYRDTMIMKAAQNPVECSLCRSTGLVFARKKHVPSSGSISFRRDPLVERYRLEAGSKSEPIALRSVRNSFGLPPSLQAAIYSPTSSFSFPLEPIREDHREFEMTRMTV